MPPVRSRARWRVFILIRGVKYYANICSTSPLPRVAWHMYSAEYPDDFDKATAQMIVDYYSDQKPRLDRVMLVDDEEENW